MGLNSWSRKNAQSRPSRYETLPGASRPKRLCCFGGPYFLYIDYCNAQVLGARLHQRILAPCPLEEVQQRYAPVRVRPELEKVRRREEGLAAALRHRVGHLAKVVIVDPLVPRDAWRRCVLAQKLPQSLELVRLQDE